MDWEEKLIHFLRTLEIRNLPSPFQFIHREILREVILTKIKGYLLNWGRFFTKRYWPLYLSWGIKWKWEEWVFIRRGNWLSENLQELNWFKSFPRRPCWWIFKVVFRCSFIRRKRSLFQYYRRDDRINQKEDQTSKATWEAKNTWCKWWKNAQKGEKEKG